MKKIIKIIIILLICFACTTSFVACDKDHDDPIGDYGRY